MFGRNTGHDFGGRSAGAGSLSIWTHSLKSFQFIREYTMGSYTGMAVRIGAGLEADDLYNYMAQYGITVVAPGDGSVGAAGGWFACGGHGTLTSYYGLGSDGALSIQVVTADGRLVTASPTQNEDLFFALRGGGGSVSDLLPNDEMTIVADEQVRHIRRRDINRTEGIPAHTGGGKRP
jgi:FAD binding domain